MTATPNRRVANPAIVTGVSGSNFAEDVDAEVAQLWRQASNFLGVVGGSANALTGSCPIPLIGAYATGNTFEFVTGAAANTASVTLNVDNKGAVVIKTPAGISLTSGQLKANTKYRVTYNGTDFVLEGGFVDVSALSPRMNLINTWTYSVAVTSLSFSGLGGYRNLRLLFQGLSSAFAAFVMDFSTDGGATWITTGNRYFIVTSNGTPTASNQNTFTNAGSNNAISGLFNIWDFNQGIVPYWKSDLTSTVDSAPGPSHVVGYMAGNYTFNALRIRSSSGNLDAGTVKLYGEIG